MKTNMGAVDRVIRLFLVVLITLLYFTNNITGTAAIILGILALIFLGTSFTGFCPLYYPFKIRTTERNKSE